jgi:DNA-binding CsgD family transcriptional regulator
MGVAAAQRRWEFLEILYRLQRTEEFCTAVTGYLSQLVAGDRVMVSQHNGVVRQLTGVTLNQPFSHPEFLAEANAGDVIGEHPFWQVLLSEQLPVKVLSEMVSERCWRENVFQHEVLRSDGVRDHISIEFGDSLERFMSVGVMRGSVGFSAEERATMHFLLPHFKLAFHNAQLYEQQCNLRQATGSGIFELDWRCMVPAAEQRLRGWLTPALGSRAATLWPSFRHWLKQQQQALNRGWTRAPQETWQARIGSTVLRIVISRDFLRGRYLLFRTVEACGTSGHRCGLSLKQRQILAQLVIGKSNREIAGHMGISGETVKTHLQHIFRKLGVDNRTAAARCWAQVSSADGGFAFDGGSGI